MPRRIGTLTFHQSGNYGAVLQAYGLASAIREMGHPVEIIDYRPPAARQHYVLFPVRSRRPFKVLAKRWKFYKFRKRCLPLSPRTYLTAGELKSHPPDVDCVLCGSDQVWNVSSFRGFDPPFFLDFAEGTQIKRASYAATFGSLTDLGPHREPIANLLRAFDFISVRDLHSQKLVSDLIGRIPTRVLDPSFLGVYEPITPPPLRTDPYLMAYCVEPIPEFHKIAATVSRKLGLSIVGIGAPVQGAESYLSAGPQEWLSLVKHASFVLTNSFHGLCFSVIHRKDFFVVPHSERQMRLQDLMAWLNLSDRVATDPRAVEAMSDAELAVDYSRVEPAIGKALDDSREFLGRVLRG